MMAHDGLRGGFCLAPEGRRFIARGASRWESHRHPVTGSPGGATVAATDRTARIYCRPFGARVEASVAIGDVQGLAPLARECRPSGAQNEYHLPIHHEPNAL